MKTERIDNIKQKPFKIKNYQVLKDVLISLNELYPKNYRKEYEIHKAIAYCSIHTCSYVL